MSVTKPLLLPSRLVTFCSIIFSYLVCGPSTAMADLLFPQIAAGGGYVTVLTLIHTDARTGATAAAGTLRFFNPDGTARTVTTSEMGDGSQFNVVVPIDGVRVLTITSNGPLAVGAARFDISGVAVGGVATFTFESAVVGVLAATPVRLGYIPLNTRTGFSNGVALQNPGAGPVSVTFRLLDASGNEDQRSQPAEVNPLPPNGQYSRFVGPEMGFNGSVKADSTLEISVQGSGTIAALPLVLGNSLFSSAAIISDDSESPLVFPQVVDGGGYTTTIRLFNPNTQNFTGTMRFFSQDGTPRSVSLVGKGTATQFDVSIPPKGTSVLQSSGAGTNVQVGMGRLDSFAVIGGTATIFFGAGHVGVPASPKMRSVRIPLNTTTGYNTGVALGSASTGVNLDLSLTDRDGRLSDSLRRSDLNPLVFNGQFARYATQMGFNNTSGLADGSLLITASTSGTFTPLALLDRNGVFSTTAVARQTLYGPTAYVGNYSGTWTDTEGDAGTITASFSINSASNIGTFTLQLGGDAATDAATFSGPVTDEGFKATLANGTLSIKSDGTLTLRPTPSSSASIQLTLDGEFSQNRFNGRLEAIVPGVSPSVRGTWSLTKL